MTDQPGPSSGGTPARAASLVGHASELFARWCGSPPVEIGPVSADGSSRRYWRLTAPDGTAALAAHGPDREENRAFLSFTGTFRELGLPVPEVYASDQAEGVYLLEDLGDLTLFGLLQSLRSGSSDAFPEEIMPTYEAALALLPRFQTGGGKRIDFSVAYPRAAFDEQSIAWDLNYFKYHFLKLAHIPFNEQRLERDFAALTDLLLRARPKYFLYRDFQSRNVMVKDGSPWFIDYQGGRLGASQYDVASLLYDAKARIPDPVRLRLLDVYLGELGKLERLDRARWMELWPGFVLIRILQALGAYGYRGFFERKPHFLQSVPFAAANLARLLEGGLPLKAPELEGALRAIVDRWPTGESDDRAADGTAGEEGSASPAAGPAPLTVVLRSFSFRGGYPRDDAGHGGGYVFDCRGLPNPGRDPRYRALTGLDEEVREFMAARPETGGFWERVAAMVDSHLNEFQKRGFDSLTVSFGCTGGQHRSVYMAERLRGRLESHRPDVRVELAHLERDRWPSRG